MDMPIRARIGVIFPETGLPTGLFRR